jgi:preprotein translocase subunit Sec61beta
MINMAKQKMQMPSGQGGLIRYFDSEKEAVRLKPEHIVGVCAVIIALELLLRFGLIG